METFPWLVFTVTASAVNSFHHLMLEMCQPAKSAVLLDSENWKA